MSDFNEEIWIGEDGFTYDVLDGTTRLGVLIAAADTELHGQPANKDTWMWETGETPWPDDFDLENGPISTPLPGGNTTSYDQVTFTAALANHDLSSSSLKVWKIVLFKPGPDRADVGWFTRHTTTGAQTWYAKPIPQGDVFRLGNNEKLEFRHVDNSGLTSVNACEAD